MPEFVVSGAMLTCTFGVAPGPFTAMANQMHTAGGMPIGVITDIAPMAAIPSFGMCTTPSNPVVAAATSAAMGVLTPQACIPATTAPWSPGSASVTVNEIPAIDSACTCQCMWGGVISVTSPGQIEASG
jgi:hypothetical protein